MRQSDLQLRKQSRNDFRKGQDKPNEYVPTGCPGGRAPHLWLGDEHSLYDAFGFEFTFLRLGANRPTQLHFAPQRRRKVCR